MGGFQCVWESHRVAERDGCAVCTAPQVWTSLVKDAQTPRSIPKISTDYEHRFAPWRSQHGGKRVGGCCERSIAAAEPGGTYAGATLNVPDRPGPISMGRRD